MSTAHAAKSPSVKSKVAESMPIMPAPTRVRPAVGETKESRMRKNVSASGSSALAALRMVSATRSPAAAPAPASSTVSTTC